MALRSRSPIAFRSLILLTAALAFPACVYQQLPLDGLACNAEHACADGYACVASACVKLGQQQTGCDPSTLGAQCSVGVGACASSGTFTCQNGTAACSAVPGASSDEVCDGVDNDCDGSADEELTPPPCALTQGVCASAHPSCGGTSGWSSCDYGTSYQASETACDGLDNDCDGQVDEISSCNSIVTIAGDGPPGFRDGGPADSRFAQMRHMAADADGNLYVSDYHNHAIRKITPTGDVTTVVGDGTCGLNDGAVGTAKLCYPWGLAIAADGTIFFSDAGNHRVRAISGGVVSTVAGSSGGFANGAAASALFNQPTGLFLEPNGDLLIADRKNAKIRRWVKASATVETVAGSTEGLTDGNRTTMQLKLPTGVVEDATGTIYVSEQSHRIRKIPVSGTSSTVAGQTNGTGGTVTEPDSSAGTAVKFNLPDQILLDSPTTPTALYVADSGNFRIRKVPLDPTQSTLAVVGGSANGLKNGTGTAVKAGSVTGFVKVGNVFYFTDSNGLVRKGTDVTGTYSASTVEDFVGGLAGTASGPPVADGAALTARLRRPQGLTRDAAGVIYWVEREGNSLRKLENGQVTTLIGGALGGYANGAFSAAKLDNPRDVTIGPDGRLYIAESFNSVIRVADLAGGTISTLSGPDVKMTGYADSTTDRTAVLFNSPTALTFGTGARANTLIVADSANCVLRSVDPVSGASATIAGTQVSPCAPTVDGDRATARFKLPVAVTSDAGGNLYVADVQSTTATKIRKVAPDGSVTTLYDLAFAVNMLAFDGTRLVATGDQSLYTLTVSAPYVPYDYFVTTYPGWRDGPFTSAGALEMYGITVGGGDYYLTDELNHRVRKLRKQP